jgi:serine/threonine protein kinase
MELTYFSCEATVLAKIAKAKYSCGNIVKAFESDIIVSPDGKSYYGYIIYQYLPNKDLFDYVERKITVSNERLCCTIFAKILRGISFLHHVCNTAHMDIKLDNVMLDTEFNPKIIDFGLSHDASAIAKGFFGTTETAAPEMFLDAPYDPVLADMYKLGVLLYSMVFGNPPLESANRKAMTDHGKLFFDDLTSGSPAKIKMCVVMQFRNPHIQISDSLVNLLARLL